MFSPPAVVLIGCTSQISQRYFPRLTDRRRLVRGVLRSFADQKTKTAASQVLRLAPLLDDSSLQMVAEKAIAATAGPADAEMIESAVSDADWRRRSLAAVAATAVFEKDADQRLKALLTDDHAAVRLSAVRALASSGDPGWSSLSTT